MYVEKDVWDRRENQEYVCIWGYSGEIGGDEQICDYSAVQLNWGAAKKRYIIGENDKELIRKICSEKFFWILQRVKFGIPSIKISKNKSSFRWNCKDR